MSCQACLWSIFYFFRCYDQWCCVCSTQHYMFCLIPRPEKRINLSFDIVRRDNSAESFICFSKLQWVGGPQRKQNDFAIEMQPPQTTVAFTCRRLLFLFGPHITGRCPANLNTSLCCASHVKLNIMLRSLFPGLGMGDCESKYLVLPERRQLWQKLSARKQCARGCENSGRHYCKTR